jgi:mono/diheme cytochrome c family protein/uncharacterized cupredoxin-like copper-binding protein
MSEPRTGRELTPRDDDGRVAPVPEGDRYDVERFSAGPRAHTAGLTEERAGQIVKQSGSARNVAFLATLLIAIFIPVYWFYDIGVTALGVEARMDKNIQTQYVTDVARGYELFLNNCTTCHGQNGEGGIGPPLNDQAKLYNALTADGKPGTGHLNPTYLNRVMEVGGRYVCGDAKSVMPAWLQPAGPLNYRQVEELISFLTASTETEFEYPPEGAHTTEETVHRTVSGWRDPEWTPAPGATPPPACWRNPSGVIGGSGGTATASAAPIENPGTPDAPREIELSLTAQLEILDSTGAKAASIPVKAGETVQFTVDNTAGFDHNFYIGQAADLEANAVASLTGIPQWTEGVQTLEWTVPEEGSLQFACTLIGHYGPMHGAFVIQP